jgi:hypothetical protein
MLRKLRAIRLAVMAGMATAGIGIPGSTPIRFCPQMESFTVRLVGDSIYHGTRSAHSAGVDMADMVDMADTAMVGITSITSTQRMAQPRP